MNRISGRLPGAYSRTLPQRSPAAKLQFAAETEISTVRDFLGRFKEAVDRGTFKNRYTVEFTGMSPEQYSIKDLVRGERLVCTAAQENYAPELRLTSSEDQRQFMVMFNKAIAEETLVLARKLHRKFNEH